MTRYRLRDAAPLFSASRRVALYSLVAPALTGCAAGGLVGKGLEIVGLKKPEPSPEMNAALQKLQGQRDVTLRIHAAQWVNVDENGRALSLVTRIYRLRSTAQFTQAPYAMFSTAGTDHSAFEAEVVSMKEVVLKPGQKYEVVETMLAEVTHLAVVGLFRAPDRQRWRFVFETRAAVESGITLGAHGCALSVATGAPIGAPPEVLGLAGVQCR